MRKRVSGGLRLVHHTVKGPARTRIVYTQYMKNWLDYDEVDDGGEIDGIRDEFDFNEVDDFDFCEKLGDALPSKKLVLIIFWMPST